MKKIKIYIVDDDETIRFLLKENLEMENYEVLDFSNGEEALGAVKKEQSLPALLVTDLHMPGMNGEVLIEEFKSMFPEIPAIITSGDFGKLGTKMADAICPKPFDLPILLDTIERLIGQSY